MTWKMLKSAKMRITVLAVTWICIMTNSCAITYRAPTLF